MNTFENTFECHMYVTKFDELSMMLPVEDGPQRVARLEPMTHDKLIDPKFRRLLAAFESVKDKSIPKNIVQV
jgi:hypothetical protein